MDLIKENLDRLLFLESFKKSYLMEMDGKAKPFKKITNKPGELIEYEFFLDENNRYEILMTPTSKGGNVGTYELIYKHEKQNSSQDLMNLESNTAMLDIIMTFIETMNIEAKENNIRVFRVEGVPSEKDHKRGRLDNTRRANIYYQLFSKNYPIEAIHKEGSVIYLNMVKVFPEYFESEENKSLVNKLAKLLFRVSDKRPDMSGIMDSFEGNDLQFTVATDELENSKYGGLDLDIMVDQTTNKYEVEYNKFVNGEGKSSSFNNAPDMFKFLMKELT